MATTSRRGGPSFRPREARERIGGASRLAGYPCARVSSRFREERRIVGRSRTARWIGLGCAALAAFAWPAVAAAEDSAVSALSLSWSTAPSCPDREAVLLRVGSLLGSSPAASEPISAAGTITAVPSGGYSLELETTQLGQTHRRTLAAPTCEELSDAGALIVALAVDPKLVVPASSNHDAQFEPSPSQSSGSAKETSVTAPPGAPPPDPAPPPTPPPPTPERPRSAATPLELRASVGGFGDVGTLSRPAAGVNLSVGLARETLRLELLGAFLPPVRRVIAEAPERGGDMMLVAGGLRGCVTPLEAAFETSGCVGLEAGALLAESFNATARNSSGRSGWFAGRAGVTSRLALTPVLALALDLEALIPATRPKFLIEHTGVVHQPGVVAVRLAVGIELTFFRRKAGDSGTKNDQPWQQPPK
jgi:hypothetical protein